MGKQLQEEEILRRKGKSETKDEKLVTHARF